MTTEIHDPVEVLASFSRENLRPRMFVWRKRRYAITKITASWIEPQGAHRRHYFAVLTDGANLYELCFGTRDLVWHLVRIHQD